MKVIGVTGSFGMGKTTVAGFFKDLGAVVLDADEIAHKALLPKSAACKKILKIFGNAILNKHKEIDRESLGKLVFKDESLLRKLCRIIHPVVIKDIKIQIKRIKEKTSDAVVVLDVPLLIEADLINLVDKLIVVKTNKKIQISRCRKKTGLDEKEILARIKAQMPLREKIRFSDFIIDNNRTKSQTKREVKKIWEKIQ